MNGCEFHFWVVIGSKPNDRVTSIGHRTLCAATRCAQELVAEGWEVEITKGGRLDSALEDMDPVVPDTSKMSVRKQLYLENGSYSDRSDGFARSCFSRSKNLFSRIRKMLKPSRVKPPHKR